MDIVLKKTQTPETASLFKKETKKRLADRFVKYLHTISVSFLVKGDGHILCYGSNEVRKCKEKELIYTLGTLKPQEINVRNNFFFFIKLFKSHFEGQKFLWHFHCVLVEKNTNGLPWTLFFFYFSQKSLVQYLPLTVQHLDTILHLDGNTYNRCDFCTIHFFFCSYSNIRQGNEDVSSRFLHISLLPFFFYHLKVQTNPYVLPMLLLNSPQ